MLKYKPQFPKIIRKTKIKMLLFFILCAAALLAGCKKEEEHKQKEKVRLEFYNRKREMFSVMDQIIRLFNESQDEIEVYQNMNPNVDTSVRIDAVKGEMPDILELSGLQGIESFEYIRGGYLLPLTGEDFMGRVKEDYLCCVDYDGEIYQVPLALSYEGIFLNKTLFEQAGFAIPKTYEELLEVSVKIRKRGESAFLFADGESWPVHQNWENIESAYRGTFWDIWSDVAEGRTTFEKDDISRGAMEKLLELHQFTLLDSVSIGYDEAVKRFAQGEAYMFMQGNWAYQALKKQNPQLNLQMIPFPVEEGYQQKLTLWVDSSAGISSACKYPEEAKKFLEFLSRPEILQIYIDQGFYISCIQGVEDRADYTPGLQDMIAEHTAVIDNAVLPLAPSTIRDLDIGELMPDAGQEQVTEYLQKYTRSLQKHRKEFLEERDKIR